MENLSERMDRMETKVCYCNDARVTEGSREEPIKVESLGLKYASQDETEEEDEEYHTLDLARERRALLDRMVSPSPELQVIDEVTPKRGCSAGVLATELGSNKDVEGGLVSDMYVSLVCSVLCTRANYVAKSFHLIFIDNNSL